MWLPGRRAASAACSTVRVAVTAAGVPWHGLSLHPSRAGGARFFVPPTLNVCLRLPVVTEVLVLVDDTVTARFKLTEVPPAYCSGCFLAQPESRHVDFGVSWDGPVIGEGDGRSFIDDLVLCEKCVRDAAALVGAGDVTEQAARVAMLESELATVRERLAGLADYATRLEEAARQRETVAELTTGRVQAVRQQVPAPVKRKPGRPPKNQQAKQGA